MDHWPAIVYCWSLAGLIILFILLKDRQWRFTLRFHFVLMTLVAILVGVSVILADRF